MSVSHHADLHRRSGKITCQTDGSHRVYRKRRTLRVRHNSRASRFQPCLPHCPAGRPTKKVGRQAHLVRVFFSGDWGGPEGPPRSPGGQSNISSLRIDDGLTSVLEGLRRPAILVRMTLGVGRLVAARAGRRRGALEDVVELVVPRRYARIERGCHGLVLLGDRVHGLLEALDVAGRAVVERPWIRRVVEVVRLARRRQRWIGPEDPCSPSSARESARRRTAQVGASVGQFAGVTPSAAQA